MKTRDGVTLRADVYRPKADGKFPVLLNRTPYDKRGDVNYLDVVLPTVAKGYVCIIQDTRGRYASDGEWAPFLYEAQDGYDTVEWAAALPYANGKVGLFGGSYMGATQLLAAMAAPPHLAGICPVATASNYYGHWAYHNGPFEQLFAQTWCSLLSFNEIVRRVSRSVVPADWDMKRPLAEYPLVEPGTAASLPSHDYYAAWLAHPTYDDYWKQCSIEEHYDKITVPALHIAAWYDLFQDGSIRNYEGIKQHGGSEAARKNQRLVIIPGGHAGRGLKLGEVDFSGKVPDLNEWELLLRWYDYVLKGIDDGISREKPVKIFVMGRNIWRDEDDWPLARAQSTRYYLHSEGKANTLTGDGRLSPALPAAEPADKYLYDPADPTPTHGGAILGLPAGPLDQRVVEARSDVLVYTTPAFQQDTEVTGPVSLEIYVSSSVVDTDFTGKLVDVWPNGFVQNLTDGILRMRYRNSLEKAELMNPGEIYKLTINLWSTSNVFLAGHKLRLEIASSNFPRFDRNLNTGLSAAHSSASIAATNVVYHDRDHPSALILPVVP
ncbi:MAG: CocE/NonD family hydrolase [Opitutaceae bacterium]|nr:CocE/NonD family hydrolase [Opitutaceae bacterium]